MNTLHWNIGLPEKAFLPFYQVIHLSVSFVFKKKRSLDCARIFQTKLCYHPAVKSRCMNLWWAADQFLTNRYSHDRLRGHTFHNLEHSQYVHIAISTWGTVSCLGSLNSFKYFLFKYFHVSNISISLMLEFSKSGCFSRSPLCSSFPCLKYN